MSLQVGSAGSAVTRELQASGCSPRRVSAAERAGRTPWILGLLVPMDARGLGVGRLLLTGLPEAAAGLGHPPTWVATGIEAVWFYRRCGWESAEYLRLTPTGTSTTIWSRPTGISSAIL